MSVQGFCDVPLAVMHGPPFIAVLVCAFQQLVKDMSRCVDLIASPPHLWGACCVRGAFFDWKAAGGCVAVWEERIVRIVARCPMV